MNKPALLPQDMHERLAAIGQTVEAPKGAVLFRHGDACKAFVWLVSGRVRVQQTSENGRTLVLYHIGPGESCIVTTACLLADDPYPAEAVVEEPAKALLLPRAAFEDLLASDRDFRAGVFQTYGQRLVDVMGLLTDLAFEPLDARLSRYLLRAAGAGADVNITQDHLAAALGAAREAVNRQLNLWQKADIVALSRGTVRLLDKTRLTHIAGSAD